MGQAMAQGCPGLEVVLVENKAIVASMVNELEVYWQRDSKNCRRIASLEEQNSELLQSMEELEREVVEYRSKEKEYLGRLEQLEVDLERLESEEAEADVQRQSEPTHSSNRQVVEFLEKQLARQTSQA